MESAKQTIDGLLTVNKPVGMVSKDVSRFLTRRLGKKLKLGHVGTLDPAASGVLPILLGRATRLQDYLLDMPKSYEFDMVFGSETDTLDLEGQVVREGPVVTDRALIEDAASVFLGEIEQIPPIYSAVKYKGKPLYDYARKGKGEDIPVTDLKRRVRIETLTCLDVIESKATFSVRCSRGTYVRTLVQDIAAYLGTCATLTRLVRTEAAGRKIEVANGLEAIETAIEQGGFDALVTPVEDIDLGMPKWQPEDLRAVDKLRSGQPVVIDAPSFAVDGFSPASWARPLILLNEHGKAFGMGAVRRDGGQVVINMKRGL